MKQEFAVGITIETLCEDAMAARRKAVLSFPLHGPFPDMDAVAEAIGSIRDDDPCSLSQAKDFIANASQPDVFAPLSAAEFYDRANTLINEAEQAVAHLDPDSRECVLRALDQALFAGILLATGRIRAKHLKSITIEVVKCAPARFAGGKAKLGVFFEDTIEIAKEMHGLLQAGRRKSKRAAAREVLARRHSNVEAASIARAVKRYDYHHPSKS